MGWGGAGFDPRPGPVTLPSSVLAIGPPYSVFQIIPPSCISESDELSITMPRARTAQAGQARGILLPVTQQRLQYNSGDCHQSNGQPQPAGGGGGEELRAGRIHECDAPHIVPPGQESASQAAASFRVSTSL